MGRTRRCAALLAGAALAGCAPRAPELGVEEQWTDAMRRLSLFAIYPMNEDVRLGDVFLYVPPADGISRWADRNFSSTGAMPRFAATAMARPPCDLLVAQLIEQGRGRMRMPVLAGAASAKPAQPPERGARVNPSFGLEGDECRLPAGQHAGRPQDNGEIDVGSSDDLVSRPSIRLQAAGIPKLAVARLTEGQLGGSGIFGNFGAQLGIGSSGQVALTIELKRLQMMTLEFPRAFRLLEQSIAREYRLENEPGRRGPGRTDPPRSSFTPMDVLRALAQVDPALADAACHNRFERIEARGAQVVIANRILYAGGIEYSFGRASQTAARLAVDLQNTLPVSIRKPPSVPPLPNAGAASRGGAAAGNAGKGEGAAEAEGGTNTRVSGQNLTTEEAARLAALMGSITGGPEGSLAGVQGQFGVGSTGQLTLSGDFARPMAVGFGSGLGFPIAHAMLPHSGQEVIKAVAYCRLISPALAISTLPDGSLAKPIPPVPLELHLNARLAWVAWMANAPAGTRPPSIAVSTPSAPSAAPIPDRARTF